MLNSKSSMPLGDLTSMSRSSSMQCKDESTGTTVRSRKNGSVGGLIGKGRELESESLLWRAVLGQAIRDVYCGTERDRQSVYQWTCSGDFATVCDYAFVHPEDMKEQIYALMELSPRLARKYGQMLRGKIIGEN